jgi:hypothetical protein
MCTSRCLPALSHWHRHGIRIRMCQMPTIPIAMNKKLAMLAIAAAVLLLVTLLTVPAFLASFIIQGD